MVRLIRYLCTDYNNLYLEANTIFSNWLEAYTDVTLTLKFSKGDSGKYSVNFRRRTIENGRLELEHISRNPNRQAALQLGASGNYIYPFLPGLGDFLILRGKCQPCKKAFSGGLVALY